VQEADVNGQIDAANAELALAQQQSSLKGQDLRQLEGRRENLHQQVRRVVWGYVMLHNATSCWHLLIHALMSICTS
jgi:hypothetical protein